MKNKTITAYKAFDKDLKCRDFQYEIGKEYEHNGYVEVCASGFHACENPLDVLNYYDLCESRFAEVEMSGDIKTNSDDSKLASKKIKIKAEFKLGDFIKASVEYITKKVNKSDDKIQAASGNSSQLAASGDCSKLAIDGLHSVGCSVGINSKIKGVNGTLICLVEFDKDYKPLQFVTGKIGENGLKENTYYTVENGQFKEYK